MPVLLVLKGSCWGWLPLKAAGKNWLGCCCGYGCKMAVERGCCSWWGCGCGECCEGVPKNGKLNANMAGKKVACCCCCCCCCCCREAAASGIVGFGLKTEKWPSAWLLLLLRLKVPLLLLAAFTFRLAACFGSAVVAVEAVVVDAVDVAAAAAAVAAVSGLRGVPSWV